MYELIAKAWRRFKVRRGMNELERLRIAEAWKQFHIRNGERVEPFVFPLWKAADVPPPGYPDHYRNLPNKL